MFLFALLVDPLGRLATILETVPVVRSPAPLLLVQVRTKKHRNRIRFRYGVDCWRSTSTGIEGDQDTPFEQHKALWLPTFTISHVCSPFTRVTNIHGLIL